MPKVLTLNDITAYQRLYFVLYFGDDNAVMKFNTFDVFERKRMACIMH